MCPCGYAAFVLIVDVFDIVSNVFENVRDTGIDNVLIDNLHWYLKYSNWSSK